MQEIFQPDEFVSARCLAQISEMCKEQRRNEEKMTARYLHMLSWGLLYAAFSLIVVCLYRNIDRTKRGIRVSFGEKKVAKIHFSDVVVYLIITTVSAIRLNTGSDFYNYYLFFNQVRERYISFREVILQSQGGYYALSWIVKIFSDYEYAIFVVIAVISYAYLFYILRSEIEDLPCALLCYMFLGYYAYSNNILKQYIAMAFIMYAYLNYTKKKFIRAAISVFLAVSFHYSAIFIVLIMYLVQRIEPGFGVFWLSIAGGIGISLALSQILSIMISLLPSASGYEKYIHWRRSGQFRLIAAVFGMLMIYMLLTFVIIKYKDNIRSISEKRYREIIFLVVGLGINVIALRQWIINRLAIYFYQFIILILPVMFRGMEIRKRRRIKIFLYIAMFFYMIFSSIFLGENEYYSYNTVFSGEQAISDVEYNRIHGWSR